MQIQTHTHHVHRATQRGVEEVTQRLEVLEDTRELARLTRSSTAAIDEQIKLVRQQLEKAKKPTREFSDQTRQDVKAYLKGTGPLPAEPEPEQLQIFGRLVSRGVRFVEGQSLDPLPPDEAYLKLVALEYHAREEQIGVMTRSPLGLQTVTLRPEYLDTVDFFLDKTLEGSVFYREPRRKETEPVNPDGYVKIDHLSDFIFAYQDRPEDALVHAGGSYVTYRERATMREDMEQFIADASRAPVPIEDLGDAVVVGGIILDKEQDW